MAAHQADLPDKLLLGDSWGLGWIRFGWDGHRLIGHDGNTIGQAALPARAARPGRQGLAVALLTNGGHARDLYEDLYARDLRRARRRRPAGAVRPPAEPVTSTSRRTSARYERDLGADGGRGRPDGPLLRTTVIGPLAELVPDPVDEYPLVPVGPGAVRGEAARGGDLDPGHLLRAADRRAVRALRRARHPAGVLPMTDLDLLLADVRALVECESPSPTWPPSRASAEVVARVGTAPARGRAGADRARRPHPPALAARRRPAPGPAARPPRHRVAARLAGRPPVRGRGRRAARARLLRHEGRAGDGVPRRPPAWTGVTILVTGDEEIGSPSSRALIEDEARGPPRRWCSRRRPTAARSRPSARASRSTTSDVDRPRRARRARAGEGRQRDRRARPPGAGRRGAGRRRRPAPPSRRPSCRPGTTTNTVPGRGLARGRRPRARPLAEQDRVDRAPARAAAGAPRRAASRCTAAPNRPPLEARLVGGAVRAGLGDRGTAGPARADQRRGRRRLRRQLHRRASARPPWTASARSAAARTPTTSTSWSTSCPGAPRCCAPWSRTCWTWRDRRTRRSPSGAGRP